jgi:hypothetical protein
MSSRSAGNLSFAAEGSTETPALTRKVIACEFAAFSLRVSD